MMNLEECKKKITEILKKYGCTLKVSALIETDGTTFKVDVVPIKKK